MTKLTRAWVFDSGEIVKAESASLQLPDDPFRNLYAEGGDSGLVPPPYDLDRLSETMETNTLHARAVKQKASDVAGRGFFLRAADDEASTDQAETRFGEFLESVELGDDRGDESFKERIVAAHEDYESVGWGVLEVSRRGDDVPDGVWHVPAHTLRAHTDGRRFAQKRGGKTVWFKRFGLAGSVNRTDGGWSDGGATPASLRGNELLVLRNYTSRSSHYGLPDHIPAMAAIAGWRALAEFNVRFFDRTAVPSYAVVLEGADMSPEVETMIREHFEAIRGKPHATLVIPVPGVPGDEAAQPKLRFEKLTADVKDASFRLYKQDNAMELCIAHGIPPYRIGWPVMGSLGGATAEEMTQIYNDSIVQPRQETWELRLARALLGPKGLDLPGMVLKAHELDTRNETRDLERARGLYVLDAITPNQIAAFFDLDPGEHPNPNGDLYRSQLPGGGLIDPDELVAKRWSAEVTSLATLRKEVERLLEPARATA
jgi:PBSX family phage portal protein